jgi:hypothetical protein
VLSLAIGSGLTLAQLLFSVASWHTSRPGRYTLRVERDGRTVEVTSDDQAELASLATQLEAAVGRPEAG